jgi:hypothetical protein
MQNTNQIHLKRLGLKLKPNIAPLLFLIFSIPALWFSLPATAGELRPFVLPSNKTYNETMGGTIQERTLQQAPPSVYQKFSQEVRQMTPEQRVQFKKRYQELRFVAEKEKNWIEMDYYQNLLMILNQYE